MRCLKVSGQTADFLFPPSSYVKQHGIDKAVKVLGHCEVVRVVQRQHLIHIDGFLRTGREREGERV